MNQTNQSNEPCNVGFNGTNFAGGVMLVVLIILLLFGSTDLAGVSNSPGR